MTKPQNQFKRSGSINIEWLPKEKYFICWRPHCSMLAGDKKGVLKFARWPASTPTGTALREWLDEILQATPQAVPDTAALAAATGFGPEQHDAEDHDPTANTRTII